MDKMVEHSVVPDVIDKVPTSILEITYPNGVEVQIGGILTPAQVKDTPTFYYKMNQIDSLSYFTLIMTDPDSPSRKDPKYREWQHWLFVNILGYNKNSGEELSPYIGAGPPIGTDYHRYVFLLYRHSQEKHFKEPRLTNTSGKLRAYFNTRAFAKKYELGPPIAGTFFLAKYDNYVPHLYYQLTQSK